MKAPSAPRACSGRRPGPALSAQRSTAGLSDGNGGQTTTSATAARAIRGRNSSRKRSVSSTVLCIFQLAASDAASRSGILQRLHSGQRLALHQLQRGAAAGREPVDRSARPNCAARRPSRRRRPRCGPAPRRPPRRPRGCRRRTAPARRRPSARSRTRSRPARSAWRSWRRVLRADVEAHPAVRHVDPVELPALGVGVEALCRARGPPAARGSQSLPSASASTRFGRARRPPPRPASRRCRGPRP